MTRRGLLLGAAAVAAAGAQRGSRWRRAAFDETELTIELAIDPAHDGVRLAQLSDLHLGLSTPRERIRAAVDAVNASGVDLVVLTGDFVTNSEKPVPLIAEQLKGFKVPAYAVLGNHDHWVDAAGIVKQLGKVNIATLRNQHTRLHVRGAPLTLVGIDDGFTGHDDAAAAFKGAPRRGTRVVLTHSPPTAEKLPEGANLLCLSGHTHGGQVVVPGLTARVLRGLGQPYMRGLYPVRGNSLYVNRGLGFGRGGPAVRVGSAPEVAFFTLRHRAEG